MSGAPNLPAGFTDTFTSRYIDTRDLRQHVVTGGDGPPLLLWHLTFNRLAHVNEQIVQGREHMYFGFQFATAARKLPDQAVRHYIDPLAADPDTLRGTFAAYRALGATIAQNQQRKERRLTLPVLAIGGAEGIGAGAADTMKLAADDVQGLVIQGSSGYCLN